MFRNRTPSSRSLGVANLRVAALAAVCAVVPLATAQRNPFAGGEVSSPWEALHLNPKARVKLDYRNANVDAILAMYQRASGVTIVKDPTLVGPLTLSSAKAVPLGDAFQILSTTLSLKGYDMRKQGELLVIKKHQDDRGNNQRPDGNNDPNQQGPMTQDQAILSVYPINYANASQIARVINDVFADSGAQNFGGFRGPFGEDLTNPVDIEAAIQGGRGGGQGGFGGFGGQGGFGGGQGGRGGGQGGGQNGRGGFNFRGNQQATTLVKADYDDYSNQVIVSAPVRFQSQVKDIIKQLDKVTDTPVQTKVYHLQYASATDATNVVQNVLNANVPRGKGGATTGQTQGPQGFASAIRGQTLGSGTVTSDSRTNNIVVTATPENVKIVDQVVKELDLNVPVSSTTFVFQLNNAKADDVATLLQSAFGTRTGVNGARTNTGTNSSTGSRTTTSVSAGQQNRNNTARPGAEVIGNDLEFALKDPNAQSGELATSVGVTQGFGQNFLGGGQNNNNNNRGGTASRTFGVDQNGQVVNTRDLSNQVTAIADTNTNSLIVVTSPENAAIIREILNQLDKIPEQVMIETVIVEASLTASDKLGVTFNTSNSSSSTTSGLSTNFTNVGPTTSTTNDNQGFQYTVTGKNYGIFLNALKEDSKFQVLSSPRIFTSNNIQASINISQSIPYVTSQVENVSGTFTNQYQFLDVGIVLTVTPRITSNGFVSMDVVQTANDLQGYTSFNAPIVNQREADTRVSVQDGQTIILGGIIRKAVTTDVRKVPILGDIPLLGQLFRSKTLENDKTELLVFLTPHIVRNADEAQRLRQQSELKMSPETRKSFNEYQKTGNNDSQRDANGNPKVLPVPTPTKSDPGKTTPSKTGGG